MSMGTLLGSTATQHFFVCLTDMRSGVQAVREASVFWIGCAADMRLKLFVALPFILLFISAKVLPVGIPEGLNRHAHSEQAQPMKSLV
jgi:hypothetical protein